MALTEAQKIAQMITAESIPAPTYPISWSGDPSVIAGQTLESGATIQQRTRTTQGGRGNVNPPAVQPAVSSAPSGDMDPFNAIIQSVLSGASEVPAAINAGVGQIAKANQQITGLQQQGIDLRTAVITDAAAQAAMNADITYQQNVLSQQIQEIMGTNLEDPANALASSMQDYNIAQQNRKVARAKYDELNSVSLLEDPLGYIMAQLELPQAAAINNQYSAQEDAALNDMQRRVQLTSMSKSAITANTADEIRQRELSAARMQTKLAEASLLEAKAKNIADEGQRQMQQIQLLEANERFKDTIESRAERFRLKTETQQEEDAFNQRLAAVSASLGLVQPMTVKTLKSLGNAKEKEFWLNAANSGEFGVDFGSSVLNFNQRANKRGIIAAGGAGLVQSAEAYLRGIEAYVPQATQQLSAENQGKVQKPEKNFEAAAKLYESSVTNSVSSRTAGTNMSNPVWDSAYNPYKLQFVALNKSLGSAADNNIFKKYVDVRLAAGRLTNGNLTSEDQHAVFESILKDIGDRKISAKQAAADVAKYFQVGTSYQLSTTKYNVFGLPPATSYMYTLRGATFEDATPVDLTNPGEVERILLLRMRNRNAQNLPSMFSNPADLPLQF